MNISLPNDSRQSLGGGFTFRNNFIKGLLANKDYHITDSLDMVDVFLITSSTMITKETFKAIQATGKKIVLRVDNIPRNSRNRNTGTSRLRRYGNGADAVVFQSQWAEKLLKDYLEPKQSRVIVNGVDTSVFNEKGEARSFSGKPVYLYARYNRDETKRWETVWYRYQEIQRLQKEAKLVIVGNFSPEQVQYNFDFFRGENIEYVGVIDNEYAMAGIYRGCDKMFAPYYMDACSNTYLEAKACGVELFEPDMSGGTKEIFYGGVKDISMMVAEYINLFESL